MIDAKVIAASRSPQGIIAWTVALTYPRFIHSEVMTHREFSRNASSSRAIPVWKSIVAVLKCSAAPVEWGSNKPGMQAGADLQGFSLISAKAAWHFSRFAAIGAAWVAMKAGAHKQIVNRLLEPFSHITTLITTTNWGNWDALRDHPDADPTIRALAEKINRARNVAILNDQIEDLQEGEWHLPYVSMSDEIDIAAGREAGLFKGVKTSELLLKISAARCARVSYLTHEGLEPDIEKDLALYDRLVLHNPMHASPVEHQCTPDEVIFDDITPDGRWERPYLHGNLVGFIQYRKTLPNEAVHVQSNPAIFKEAA